MSNTVHEVSTNHGTVTIRAHDVGLYQSVDDWIRDHNPLIANALAAAGLGLSAASFYVTHVRRK